MSIKILSKELFDISKEKGIDELEVYSQSSNSLGIRYFKGQIDNYSIENSSGISCRGLYKGEMGGSYTENLNEEAINLIDSLVDNAKIINADEEKYLYEGSREYKNIKNYSEKLESVENHRKIKFLQDLERYALEMDNRVDSVNVCYYGEETGESEILNSKGLELKDKTNIAIAYISVITKENDDIQTGFEYIISRDFEDFDPELLARNVVEQAVSKLGAKPVESGDYEILFKNTAAADLLESFSSIFSAEMVQKGLSLLKGKIDKVIANDKISIIDNPHLEEGFSSRGFDAEGVATKQKYIIEKGKLKTYLYDLKTAKNDNVESTGNASRGSYKSTISISPSNMYIEAGNVSYDNMIAEMNNGIIITGLQGLHAGVNSVSGDFSLLAEGYFVQNGRIVRPVNQITVAGNYLEVLCDIKNIGNDLRFNIPSGSGTIGSPSLLTNKLSVSGE